MYKKDTVVVLCREHQQKAMIDKRVSQSCSLLPILFNEYIQKRLEEVREKLGQGGEVKVQKEKVDILWFADDTTVLAENEEKLH